MTQDTTTTVLALAVAISPVVAQAASPSLVHPGTHGTPISAEGPQWQTSNMLQSPKLERLDFTARGVKIHSAPNSHSPVLGEGFPGDGFVTSDSNGPTTWTYGTDLRTGITGYVDSNNLTPGR
ncbi:hypothetical protein ACFYTQ_35300 [Nocardia sp. NPDC004068]|uniref:hypothetical protein n=1 Tax=Nocardia sp. NPDC004068 TaxID=3364303 RepID=UPI003692E136